MPKRFSQYLLIIQSLLGLLVNVVMTLFFSEYSHTDLLKVLIFIVLLIFLSIILFRFFYLVDTVKKATILFFTIVISVAGLVLLIHLNTHCQKFNLLLSAGFIILLHVLVKKLFRDSMT